VRLFPSGFDNAVNGCPSDLKLSRKFSGIASIEFSADFILDARLIY
jgi:hypothetical protein